MYQFKVKDSEIKSYSLYLGNIAEDFTIDNIRKTGLKGSVQVFHVDYNAVDAGDILDIHRYSVTETLYKIMFRFIKNVYWIIYVYFDRSLSPKEPTKS